MGNGDSNTFYENARLELYTNHFQNSETELDNFSKSPFLTNTKRLDFALDAFIKGDFKTSMFILNYYNSNEHLPLNNRLQLIVLSYLNSDLDCLVYHQKFYPKNLVLRVFSKLYQLFLWYTLEYFLSLTVTTKNLNLHLNIRHYQKQSRQHLY